MDWAWYYEDLPEELYRVQYPGVQATLDLERGICAADTVTLIRDEQHLAHIVQQSFTWTSTFANPMVNLFSDKDHAINWAYRYSRHHGGVECLIFTIDTVLLEYSAVFQLGELVDELDIRIPDVARTHENGAYLCSHVVPSLAITEVTSCSQLNRGPRECTCCVRHKTLLRELTSEKGTTTTIC